MAGIVRVLRKMTNGTDIVVRIDRENYNGATDILEGETAPRGAGFVPPAADESRIPVPVAVTVAKPAVIEVVPVARGVPATPVPVAGPSAAPAAPGDAGDGANASPATVVASSGPVATAQPQATNAPVVSNEKPMTYGQAADGLWYMLDANGVRTHPHGIDNKADLLDIAKINGYDINN